MRNPWETIGNGWYLHGSRQSRAFWVQDFVHPQYYTYVYVCVCVRTPVITMCVNCVHTSMYPNCSVVQVFPNPPPPTTGYLLERVSLLGTTWCPECLGSLHGWFVRCETPRILGVFPAERGSTQGFLKILRLPGCIQRQSF